MKIGIVCPYNIYKGGGVQEVVFALQKGLKSKGHNVLIISPSPDKLPHKTTPGVILIGRARSVSSFHTTSQISVSVDPIELEQMLAKEKFDVLHFHEPWVPMLSSQILAKSKSANVATFHAKLPETVLTKTIEKVITPYTKSILKYFDSLTAVSTAAATYVETLTSRKINIIPNGIDTTKYQQKMPTGIELNKTILYIGRLEKRKGVKYLIKAFEQLKEHVPEATLIIAGDGPDRIKLEKYTKEKQVTKVKFLGYVDEVTKLKLLNDAALLCSPARYGESFGIVLLEAMASGTVIVAGNNPGYSTVLTGTGQISLVDTKNVADFQEKLALLLCDIRLRAAWLDWSTAEIKQYDYKNVVDKYEDIYFKALKQKNS